MMTPSRVQPSWWARGVGEENHKVPAPTLSVKYRHPGFFLWIESARSNHRACGRNRTQPESLGFCTDGVVAMVERLQFLYHCSGNPLVQSKDSTNSHDPYLSARKTYLENILPSPHLFHGNTLGSSHPTAPSETLLPQNFACPDLNRKNTGMPTVQ